MQTKKNHNIDQHNIGRDIFSKFKKYFLIHLTKEISLRKTWHDKKTHKKQKLLQSNIPHKQVDVIKLMNMKNLILKEKHCKEQQNKYRRMKKD